MYVLLYVIIMLYFFIIFVFWCLVDKKEVVVGYDLEKEFFEYGF